MKKKFIGLCLVSLVMGLAMGCGKKGSSESSNGNQAYKSPIDGTWVSGAEFNLTLEISGTSVKAKTTIETGCRFKLAILAEYPVTHQFRWTFVDGSLHASEECFEDRGVLMVGEARENARAGMTSYMKALFTKKYDYILSGNSLTIKSLFEATTTNSHDGTTTTTYRDGKFTKQ